MADWVLNPKKLRPSAQMPTMLHGRPPNRTPEDRRLSRFSEKRAAGQAGTGGRRRHLGRPSVVQKIKCAAAWKKSRPHRANWRLPKRSGNLAKQVRCRVLQIRALQMDSHADFALVKKRPTRSRRFVFGSRAGKTDSPDSMPRRLPPEKMVSSQGCLNCHS